MKAKAQENEVTTSSNEKINELKEKTKAKAQAIGEKIASAENKERLNSFLFALLKFTRAICFGILKLFEKIVAVLDKKIENTPNDKQRTPLDIPNTKDEK